MLGDPQTCLVELVGNAGVERGAGHGCRQARFAASATSSSRSVILIRGIRSYAACANGPASGGSSAFSGVIFRVRLYDDRLDVFIDATLLMTLRRGRAPASGKRAHVVDYRDVIHALRANPWPCSTSSTATSCSPATPIVWPLTGRSKSSRRNRPAA
jgi:hypothetical protein